MKQPSACYLTCHHMSLQNNYDLNHPVSTLLPEYQHNNYDFREFVDTLVVALRGMEQNESPVAHIHPVLVHEGLTTIAEVDAHDSR